MNSYSFTTDWFSHNIEYWEKILSHLNETLGKNLNCLEIGTYEGRSALYLLDNFVGDNTLTVIDAFMLPNIKHTYFENIKKHKKYEQVKTIVGNSFIELPKLLDKERFDFIYIDAGKTSAINLFHLIVGEKLLKKGGIMIVDDYEWTIEGLNDKYMPKLGISTFIEISLYCEVFMKYNQIAFKKNKVF